MATLIDVVQPQESYLESVLLEALDGRKEDVYVSNYLNNLMSLVSENPRRYRSYGPYWPTIKALVLESGYNGFGEHVDSDVVEIYKSSRPALTLIAAHLYSTDRFNNGQIYASQHQLMVAEYADDTDSYLYVSYDLEMETLISVGANRG